MKPSPKTSRILMSMALALLAASGCAHRPSKEATTQMSRAQSSIDQAEQSGAQLSAAAELQIAKDKFAEARKALDEKEDRQASRLAQEAQVDAQYAMARGQTRRQQQAAKEAQDNVEALRREVSGDGL